MNELPPNVLDLPLRQRVELALRLSGLKVIAEHKRTGLPLVIWRDEKIVHISAEELEKEMGLNGDPQHTANGTSLPPRLDDGTMK